MCTALVSWLLFNHQTIRDKLQAVRPKNEIDFEHSMRFVGGHLCNRIEILVTKSSRVHHILSHLYNNASSTKVQEADLPSNMVWPLYTDNLQAVSFYGLLYTKTYYQFT